MTTCWICKRSMPDEATKCEAGVGTRCADAVACRWADRVYSDPEKWSL